MPFGELDDLEFDGNHPVSDHVEPLRGFVGKVDDPTLVQRLDGKSIIDTNGHLPATHGESVVLRILDKNAASKEIEHAAAVGRTVGPPQPDRR